MLLPSANVMNSIFGENLFDDFFEDFARPMRTASRFNTSTGIMRTDVKENENGYELDIDLPGCKKENVKAELKNGYLTINAETRQDSDQKDEDGRYIRRERYYGTCSRSFYVGVSPPLSPARIHTLPRTGERILYISQDHPSI